MITEERVFGILPRKFDTLVKPRPDSGMIEGGLAGTLFEMLLSVDVVARRRSVAVRSLQGTPPWEAQATRDRPATPQPLSLAPSGLEP